MKMSTVMDQFASPKCKLVVEKSSFGNEKSRHLAYIDGHPLNHAVEVLLPGVDSIPDFVQDASPHLDDYYLVKSIPVSELVKEEFVNQILRKGHFTGLSIGTRVDNHSVVTVLPSGHLILSVDKDVYQELGLSGKPSKYTGRNATRFVVDVDLFNANHAAGKNDYERVVWALTDRLNLTFNLLFCWESTSEHKVNFMHLARLWDKYSIEDLSIVTESQRPMQRVIPKINIKQAISSTKGDEEEGHDVSNIFEWIGVVSCEINQIGGPGIFASSYTCPEPSEKVTNIACQRWTGLIGCQKIKQLLVALQSLLKTAKNIPFAALTVHGFDDAPISWWRNEHGFHKNGCNLYTFVMFPDDTYWLYIAVSTNDESP